MVITADLIEAGEAFEEFFSNSRLISAAFPATCGHAKEVPEAIVYSSFFMGLTEGTQISTPGAHMSGCIRLREKIDNERLLPFSMGNAL